MSDLASLGGASSRFPGHLHQCHATDLGYVELEALTAAQPRRAHHFHLGKLIVPVAHTVNGFRAEENATPAFTDSELRGRRHATKYIGSSREDMPGDDR